MTYNRLLTNEDRERYSPTIVKMFELCPEMMTRKISEANVQQAFVLDTVMKFSNKKSTILSVGCFEDTAFESLKVLMYNVAGIDPENGYDLHSFIKAHNTKFDTVFSTSVIEHVDNDEEFIMDICSILNPGGYGILTTDFRDDYFVGMPLPYSDKRFYTKNDLEIRLGNILSANSCSLIGNPNWSGNPDFWYQGHNYSFATLVFMKDSNV